MEERGIPRAPPTVSVMFYFLQRLWSKHDQMVVRGAGVVSRVFSVPFCIFELLHFFLIQWKISKRRRRNGGRLGRNEGRAKKVCWLEYISDLKDVTSLNNINPRKRALKLGHKVSENHVPAVLLAVVSCSYLTKASKPCQILHPRAPVNNSVWNSNYYFS